MPRVRSLHVVACALLLTGLLLAPRAHAAKPLFSSYFSSSTTPRGGFQNTWYPVAGDLDGDGFDDVVHIEVGLSGGGQGEELLIQYGSAKGVLTTVPMEIPYRGPGISNLWPCIDDIDGDGQFDVVLGTEDSLLVWRGLGGRLLAPVVTLPFAASGYVSARDIDGDGIPDFAYFMQDFVANTDSIFIRFGTGGLTSRPGPHFAVGPPNTDPFVQFADFNGDGRPDLHAPGIVILNQGGGVFTAFPFTASNATIVAGDLNGDGADDVLSLNGPVYLSHGDGTFSEAIPTGSPSPVLCADLDEDGILDLISDNFATASIHSMGVSKGNGDGTFGTMRLTPTVFSFGGDDVGDFDGDGHLDIVSASWDTPAMVVHYGDGIGGFRNQPLSLICGASGSVAATHRVGRTLPDLEVASSSDTTLAVLLATAPGAYAAPALYSMPWAATQLTSGDLDNDGYDDLIASNSSATALAVWRGHPDGSFGPRADLPMPGAAKCIRLADIDKDGKLDLVFAVAEKAAPLDSSFWAHGNGDGTFGSPNWLPGALGQLTMFTVVDLDHDGALDLVAANGAGGPRILRASSPGVFLPLTDITSNRSVTFVDVGYFTADSILDIVTFSDSTWIYPGLGNGSLASRIAGGRGVRGIPAFVADLDGDGLTDLFGSSTTQLASIARGTGGRFAWTEGFGLRFRPTVATSFCVTDVDGNGTPDVVVSERSPDKPLTVLINQRLANVAGVPTHAPRATHFAIHPLTNPVRGRIALRFVAASSGTIDVEVFDVTGRRCARQSVTLLPAAEATMHLEGSERWRPGVYLVRARLGDAVATTRLCRID